MAVCDKRTSRAMTRVRQCVAALGTFLSVLAIDRTDSCVVDRARHTRPRGIEQSVEPIFDKVGASH